MSRRPGPLGIDWRVVRVLLAHDLSAIRRSKAVLLPMIALPTLLFVILPAVIGLAATARDVDPGEVVRLFPEALARPVLQYPPEEQLVVLVLGYLIAPLFLIVPLMVSAVVSADTFAGEKERRTLETLLHLPVGDRDLYVAKLAGGFIPALTVAWVGFAVYATVGNVTAWPVMGRIFLPNRIWAVVVLWLAPGVAALGLGIMVRVSVRVNNTQEAQQLGGAVVLPLVMLAVGQTTSILLAGVRAALVVGAVVWAVAIVLNVRGARAYARERMASRV